jgi:hypothetical protein
MKEDLLLEIFINGTPIDWLFTISDFIFKLYAPIHVVALDNWTIRSHNKPCSWIDLNGLIS